MLIIQFIMSENQLKKVIKKYKEKFELTKDDFIQFVKTRVELTEKKLNKFISLIEEDIIDEFGQEQLTKLLHYVSAFQAGEDIQLIDDEDLFTYTKIKFIDKKKRHKDIQKSQIAQESYQKSNNTEKETNKNIEQNQKKNNKIINKQFLDQQTFEKNIPSNANQKITVEEIGDDDDRQVQIYVQNVAFDNQAYPQIEEDSMRSQRQQERKRQEQERRRKEEQDRRREEEEQERRREEEQERRREEEQERRREEQRLLIEQQRKKKEKQREKEQAKRKKEKEEQDRIQMEKRQQAVKEEQRKQQLRKKKELQESLKRQQKMKQQRRKKEAQAKTEQEKREGKQKSQSQKQQKRREYIEIEDERISKQQQKTKSKKCESPSRLEKQKQIQRLKTIQEQKSEQIRLYQSSKQQDKRKSSNSLEVIEDQNKKEFVTITQFDKVGQDFMNPVIKYKIVYKEKYVTWRRYSEIQKLMTYLRFKYEGIVLPQMPPKQGIKGNLSYFWRSTVNQQFLDQRKDKLKQLLNRLLMCQSVGSDEILLKFLQQQQFQLPDMNQSSAQSYIQTLYDLKDIVFNYNEIKDYGFAYYKYLSDNSNKQINTECSEEYKKAKDIIQKIAIINQYRQSMNQNFEKRRQIMCDSNINPKGPVKTDFDKLLEEAQIECHEMSLQYGRYVELKSTQSWYNELIKQKNQQGGQTLLKIKESHAKTVERIGKTEKNLLESIKRFSQKKQQLLLKLTQKMIAWRRKAHP